MQAVPLPLTLNQQILMVSRDYNPEFDSTPLPVSEPRMVEVVVPVFLKVMVLADDELQAEVRAVEAVRAMPKFTLPEGNAIIEMQAFISPTVR